ncbi:hypothetical protein [Streptomyces sp. DH10]|uniref:hypothetical protein n=1 Tax=Streptomyces sp. DH10 TaxID=3040121 RepID=UPI0024413D86|nr:hypothetical protein [Streptomyces sp. DH10]MDG9711159.1 hypothetical protein [Streptomyces sp. DH10]
MPQDGYLTNVEGLAQFTRALRRIGGGELTNEMKRLNFEIADKLTDATKATAAAGNRQQKSAAQSIRATKTANYAAIRLGSKRKPYALGAEFGAKKRTHKGNVIAGFGPWRGNQWGGWEGGPGYFLHPTIRSEGPALLRDYYDEIERIAREAFQ